MRMSEQIVSQQGIPDFDPLSIQGREYSYPPGFHLIFADAQIFSGLEMNQLMNFLPALYGALLCIIVFLLARKFFQNDMVAVFAALSIALMPAAIIRTAGYARPDGLAFLLIAAAIYFIFEERYAIAALFAAMLVIVHPFSAMYLFLLLGAIIICGTAMKRKIEFWKLFGIMAVSFAVFIFWVSIQQGGLINYLSNTAFEANENLPFTLIEVFTFFGFAAIFGIIGFFRNENEFLKIWIVFSLLFALIGAKAATYIAIPLALLSGYGIYYAMERLRGRENLFTILVAILVFATIIPVTMEQKAWVSDDDFAALQWIKANTRPDATIASIWDRGHVITYVAQRKVLIDGYFEFGHEMDERKAAMQTLIGSADCEKIKAAADAFGVNYLFVPSEMADNKEFTNGILEANCPKIEKVFQSGNARVFEFK
jgi:asparagine N-glycosylation enzyme membrane subunit Stt3